MADKETWKTADEILSNPVTRRRQQEQLAKLRAREEEVARQTAAILREIDDLGYPAPSIEALVREFGPLPAEIVSVLLAWVNRATMPGIQESLVRGLGAAGASFDGRPLVRCFESTDSEGLKWAVVNTIALTPPLDIQEWVENLRTNSFWDKTLCDLGIDNPRRRRKIMKRGDDG